jgi:hypothetical protein
MIRPSSVRFVLKLTQQVESGSKWGGDGKTTARAPLGPHVAAGGGRAPLGAEGLGAFGFAREREASALTGDIARFWSKVREALDRLDANTTTDGWSI